MSTTMAHRAYKHIRRKLLCGDFAPGARLRYGPIGKEIGVSATPVREAMGLLAAEGLVKVVPELGAVVRTLSRDEAIELYQMREALETYAAGWATEKLRERDLEELRALLKQIHSFGVRLRESGQAVLSDAMRREYAAIDMAFHTVIIEAAGNQALLKVVGDFHVLSRVFATDPTRYNLAMIARAYLDHGRILRALVRRDAAGARRAMEQHICNARQMVMAAFDRSRSEQRWSLLRDSADQSSGEHPPRDREQPPKSKQLEADEG